MTVLNVCAKVDPTTVGEEWDDFQPIDRDRRYIVVNVTSVCNLDCRYCYAQYDRHPNQTIDLAFAKRGIDDFFTTYPEREIRFFGSGEPTCRMDVLEALSGYARETWGDEVRLSVQTNGYFSPTVREWIAENIDEVWISCDGPPDVQNFQRPAPGGRASAGVVERNIYDFAHDERVEMGVRATVTELSYDRQLELLEYFYDLGVRTIWADHMTAPVTEVRGVSKPSYLEYARHYLDAWERGRVLGVFYGCYFMSNFGGQVQGNCRACLPYPHLTEDGQVSCCSMAYSRRQQGCDELFYGQYDPQRDEIVYDEAKVRYLRRRRVQHLAHCQDCEVRYYCAGACMGETLRETGSIFGIRPAVCEAVRFLAHHMPVGNGTYDVRHS
jgi:radical SAM protein with 4Fe4S-binding SPASM domain